MQPWNTVGTRNTSITAANPLTLAQSKQMTIAPMAWSNEGTDDHGLGRSSCKTKVEEKHCGYAMLPLLYK